MRLAAARDREPNHARMEEEQRRVRRTEAAGLTFWTLCPYCYYAHEYEKAYEGCCLRCATCRRGFHAAALRAPPEATALDGGGGGAEHIGAGGGGGHYKCRLGLFRLKYECGARAGRGEEEEEEEKKKIDVGDYLVEISSEDEGGEAKKKTEVEEEEREEEEEEEEEESGGELEFEYEGDDILVLPHDNAEEPAVDDPRTKIGLVFEIRKSQENCQKSQNGVVS